MTILYSLKGQNFIPNFTILNYLVHFWLSLVQSFVGLYFLKIVMH